MTPLPGRLGTGDVVAWRLDQQAFALEWDGGEGAYRVGGRWNSKGTRAVYCSADPATAILEVAVHKGLRALDAVPHVLTSLALTALSDVHVVMPEDLPDPSWLHPGLPRADQQSFGDGLLRRHGFVFIPSAVSSRSWNVIFAAGRGGYALRGQEAFRLDPRLGI